MPVTIFPTSPPPRSFANLANLRARLLARVHRRFTTVTETHAVGPLRLSFTRVADPDVVLDQIVEAEDLREKLTGLQRDGNDLHLPYWAELWDSALGLGEYLVEHWRDLARSTGRDKGTRGQGDKAKSNASPLLVPLSPGSLVCSSFHPLVLDLGCGQGFAGMVAAAMGAKVLLADLEPDALLFARLNTLPWRDRIRTRRLNWQADQLDETFDLVLGADVLYDRSQWDFLEPFFRAHLRPRGVVLLGEPGRQTGDMFPQWIEPRGWELETIPIRVSTRPKPIRLFKLRRLETGGGKHGLPFAGAT